MSLKTLAPQVLTSSTLRNTVRLWHLLGRRLGGKTATLHAFLEPGEPYSELLIQELLGMSLGIITSRSSSKHSLNT